jgi:hypothetical protein
LVNNFVKLSAIIGGFIHGFIIHDIKFHIRIVAVDFRICES